MSEYMIFCLGDGKFEKRGEGYQKNYRIFNKDISKEEYQDVKRKLDKANIKIKLTEWVNQKDGGYLRRYKYKEAWENWLKISTKEQRQIILDIPQFNEKVFEEITGLTKKDLKGKNPKKKGE